MTRKRTGTGRYYKKLPEPMTVSTYKTMGNDQCRNCKRAVGGDNYWKIVTVETRDFGDPSTHVQGPLCPHCSELPPENVKTYRNKDWW